MAKRFPIPEFDYEPLKGLSWSSPSLLTRQQVAEVVHSARDGDPGAFGAYPLAVSDEFFDGLNVRGPHRSAIVCVLPAQGVTLLGRSHAWKIQRVVAVDGVAGDGGGVVLEWKTPRPMNTRLGPQDGITSPAPVLTLVAGHRFGDHWIGNRVMVEKSPTGDGFRVLWADEDDRDDFHAQVVSFSWSV